MTSTAAPSPPARHARGPVTALLALTATSGALVLFSLAVHLLPAASASFGAQGLMVRVLIATSGVAGVVCAYLGLVWALASAVLLRGTAHAGGRVLMGLLRMLAPRLAQRVAASLVVTTAATGLLLGPAQAAPAPPAAPASVMEPVPVPAGGGDEQLSDAADLPPLGWGEPEQAPSPTHEVAPGESLWSITDELLSEAHVDVTHIAEAWPELYAANQDLIGSDPHRITPGQVLEIPDSFTADQEETP